MDWRVDDSSQRCHKFSNVTRFVGGSVTAEECNHWKERRPLPVVRAKVELSPEEASKNVVSALLVVSGLGSFATSFDGMPLSSSSSMDPPMTDFTQRVSYRGFDVTKHFASKTKSHVVGITLGSGWWDARPLTGRYCQVLHYSARTTRCHCRIASHVFRWKCSDQDSEWNTELANGKGIHP